MPALKLPHADGRLEAFELSSPATWRAPSQHPQWNRVAFAAAHVVAAPLAPIDPWLDAAIDWDATLAYRDSANGASILINGRCRATDQRTPLIALTNQLLIGATEREYLAQNGPEVIRERIVPRFIDSFNEARGGS